jgi:probable phosphoglycerate mutase
MSASSSGEPVETPAPKRLLLLRHGQTSWNAARRVQGQLDAELDETGHRQAAEVAVVVAAKAPAVLWSSDSVRARETAAYVAKETGLDPTYDARLREYYLADRQGLTHDEYAALAPEEFAAFRGGDFDVVPGGETAAEVSSRMVAALEELLASIAPGELAVAVSHGAAIRDAVPALLGWPVAERAVLHGLDNCGWVELDQAAPGATLRMKAYNRVATH